MTTRVAFDARTMVGDRTGIGRYMTGLLSAPAMRMTMQNATLLTNRPGDGLHLGGANISVVGSWAPPPVWEQLVLPRAIARARADVYHIPHEGGPRILGKARFVATLYDLIPLRLPELYIRSRAHALYYQYKLNTIKRHADAVITASSFSYSELQDLLGIESSRLHLIETPPDASFFRMHRLEALGVFAGRNLPDRFILSIGSAEPRKNLVSVLEAYSRLLRSSAGGAPPPPLVLFGGEWRSKNIETIVAGFGLSVTNSVRLLGRVSEEELIALYSVALCLVYASSFEGYGLPILEAMACGCPVVTTSASSLPEVAGGAAIVVDPFDVDGMMDAMESLASDSAVGSDYRARGLARVSRLNWDKTARETLRVLEG